MGMIASKSKQIKPKRKGRPPNAVISVRIGSIKPSPENVQLYRDRDADDSDYARLVDSIRANGIQTPLLVSLDKFIISGHNRYKATRAIGHSNVPVIFMRLRRDEHTADQWLAILREHNTGREKTFDELVRERLVDIDPDDAVRQIVDDQVERSRTDVASIDIGDKQMRRHGISEDKREMADAILRVLVAMAADRFCSDFGGFAVFLGFCR